MQSSERSRQGRRPQHRATRRRRRPAGPGSRQNRQIEGRQRLQRSARAIHPAETIRFFLLLDPLSPADRLQRASASRKSAPAWTSSIASSSAIERVTGESFYSITSAQLRRDAATSPPAASRCWRRSPSHRQRFLESMDDDFNTGGAVGDLFELVRTLNKFVDERKLEAQQAQRRRNWPCCAQGAADAARTGRHAGLVPPGGRRRRKADDDGLTDQLMKLIIELRADARKTKGLCHGRQDSQVRWPTSDRAGRPPRRHRVAANEVSRAERNAQHDCPVSPADRSAFRALLFTRSQDSCPAFLASTRD